jgi:hypothetical protein
MKTNSCARSILKIRAIMVCLAIAGTAGLVFCASESVAAQLGQISALRTASPQPPPINLGALFAAGR